jgi:hypothetical protein
MAQLQNDGTKPYAQIAKGEKERRMEFNLIDFKAITIEAKMVKYPLSSSLLLSEEPPARYLWALRSPYHRHLPIVSQSRSRPL